MGIFFQKRRNILSKDTDNGCLNVVVKCIGKNPQTDAEGYYKVVHHHEGIISKELFDEEQKLFVESNMEIGPDGKMRRKSTHYSSKNKIK